MFFDPITVWSFTVFTILTLAGIAFAGWMALPRESALGYWGTSFALQSIGLSGVAARGLIPDFASIGVSNALLLVALVVSWNGYRRFDGREPLTLPGLCVVLAWLAITALPPFDENAMLRIWLFTAIGIGFIGLILRELLRGSGERLMSRHIIIGVVVMQAVLMIARPASQMFQLDTIDPHGHLMFDRSLLLFAQAYVVCQMLICFCQVGMVRERREVRFREASLRDELTGLLNRRGFIAGAGDVSAKGGPMAVMAFDLDHFKQVNDRHGHEAGDRVLRRFAQILADTLRPGEVAARMGGEEFAVLLIGIRAFDAASIAERIRTACRAGAGELGLEGITLSVSIGIAFAEVAASEHREAVARLQAQADLALYSAKSAGRDRAVLYAPSFVPALAPGGPPPPG